MAYPNPETGQSPWEHGVKILGISPLDKDATVSLIEDGRVLFAAGEERYSRQKQHAGFPGRALDAALAATGTKAEEIDKVVYAFLDADQEGRLMMGNVARSIELKGSGDWRAALKAAKSSSRAKRGPVPGLKDPDETLPKGAIKEAAYELLGTAPFFSDMTTRWLANGWLRRSMADHQKWQRELESELAARGLGDKLKRYEHHLSHAANSYYCSGFDRALILTLDGYGTGLSGEVSLGEGGTIQRLQNFKFPNSMGTFYENVTGGLGFKPDRHAGKIVGLAAYGDPERLKAVLMARLDIADGAFSLTQPVNVFFERHLAAEFPKIDVAAAYQHVLEIVATELTRYWLDKTGCDHVVLSGGVTANVKMNQRIYEVDGVNKIFVYPNMGDGGCGTGLAIHASRDPRAGGAIESVYYGPEYTDTEIEAALDAEGLRYSRPEHLAAEVAQLIHSGHVVARFDGRMEYGPRALGNRSILYHGRDPEVNQWLNNRLGRTEFMPFAPVTLWEARHDCYHNVTGAEYTAQFMTITFDCTEQMKQQCPAAVHVDGTARPQLIRREVNEGYYDIVDEYRKISGIPSIINTSFNMHEEPIVCSPADAVRAFLQGNLDVLAIGPYIVHRPDQSDTV